MSPLPNPPGVANVPAGLRRLRKLAWTLDRLIPLGKVGRFGLDPIIGLIPGLGDWLGAALSLYVLYEAMRLGLPWGVLARMAVNIVIDSAVGTVPVAGDLFDFIWQSNAMNLRLVEKHYRAGLKPRSLARIWLVLALFLAGLLALIWTCVSLVIDGLAALFS